MRLNIDCIRDVLLCIEENTGLRRYCFFVDSGLAGSLPLDDDSDTVIPDYQAPLLQKYENDVLIYHVQFCLTADLAIEMPSNDGYKVFVADLSPSGHELLEKIRDRKQWSAVKKGLSAIRNYSLSAISAVAEGVTSAAINAYFSGAG